MSINTESTAKFLENAASIISDFICDHEEINKIATEIAKRESETTNWTPQEWEANENTPEYKLYYAYLSGIHQQILAEATKMCGYRFDINTTH